jgi:hypothetical protein
MNNTHDADCAPLLERIARETGLIPKQERLAKRAALRVLAPCRLSDRECDIVIDAEGDEAAEKEAVETVGKIVSDRVAKRRKANAGKPLPRSMWQRRTATKGAFGKGKSK